MAHPIPPLIRKSSTTWDRLKPVKQDALENVGFVSKGDTRLLETKAQELYYNKIVARYMQFCTSHSGDLDSAFASLSLYGSPSPSSNLAGNPPLAPIVSETIRSLMPSPPKGESSLSVKDVKTPPTSAPPSTELSIIILALRKLREALLATSSTATSPVFSQRVHVFNIRLAILTLHPPSYYPPLLHLVFVLHNIRHPLPRSELTEMTTYLILDLACRQGELASAYGLRSRSRVRFGYESRVVDAVLAAVVTGNWMAFWRMRRKVDGYIRALMHWHVEPLRKLTLKAIARSYLGCDLDWILRSTSGGELTWEELVQKEDIGWVKDGERIQIRKPKTKS